MASISAVSPAADTDVAPAPGHLTLVAVAIAGCLAAAGAIALARARRRRADPDRAARVDQRALRRGRAGRLVAAAGEPARPADGRGRLRHALVARCSSPTPPLPYTIGVAVRPPAGRPLPARLPGVPDGRLRSTFERVLVGARLRRRRSACSCVKLTLGGFGPDNLLAISADAGRRADRGAGAARSRSARMASSAIGVLADRRRHARAGRCAARWRLLVDSFALGLVMIAVLFVFGAIRVARLRRDPARDAR